MNITDEIKRQIDCFADFDVEEYQIVAALDKYTCTKCATMDKRHFFMKDFQPGITAPPFHENCRCCVSPYFADSKTGSRAARDANGKSILIPSNMTYNDWKAIYLDKTLTLENWKKQTT